MGSCDWDVVLDDFVLFILFIVFASSKSDYNNNLLTAVGKLQKLHRLNNQIA
jgi:hypothetical protein